MSQVYHRLEKSLFRNKNSPVARLVQSRSGRYQAIGTFMQGPFSTTSGSYFDTRIHDSLVYGMPGPHPGVHLTSNIRILVPQNNAAQNGCLYTGLCLTKVIFMLIPKSTYLNRRALGSGLWRRHPPGCMLCDSRGRSSSTPLTRPNALYADACPHVPPHHCPRNPTFAS